MIWTIYQTMKDMRELITYEIYSKLFETAWISDLKNRYKVYEILITDVTKSNPMYLRFTNNGNGS